MLETDSRVRNTKMALKEALLKILQKKPVDKVTVKELCEEAALNRGTFYLHNCEPNDVLKEIEDHFITEHLGNLSPYMNVKHDTSALSKLFLSMIENRELCLTLMGPNGTPRLMERIQQMIWPTMLEDWWRDFPQYRDCYHRITADCFTRERTMVVNGKIYQVTSVFPLEPSATPTEKMLSFIDSELAKDAKSA